MEFVDYVISFYGVRGIYASFFGDDYITHAEVRELYSQLLELDSDFWSCEDSICREVIRDIMLLRRGHSDVEHSILINDLNWNI